jgi:uncharacterized membrane protein SpoIIM required for sporulation
VNRDSPQALQGWLQRRHERWRTLERSLRDPRDVKSDHPGSALEFADQFRGLVRDLSLARALMPGSRITRYLESLVGRMHELIYRPPAGLKQDLLRIFMREAPAVVAGARTQILAAAWLFVVTVLAGWSLVRAYPELAGLIASETMIEKVQNGQLWTDDLLNILPSSVLSFSIISNNITVTLFAFAMGVLFGLGTLYIVVLNGLMLGGIFAFTRHYDMDGALFNFVIAHGVVELSVIVISAALGFKIGEAIIRPGERTRTAAFQSAVSDAGKVLVVIIPFLTGAGVIEGFISPDPGYPFPVKMSIGFGYFVVFWFVLTGRIWKLNIPHAKKI